MLKQYINRNLKNEFNLCTRLSSGICGDALFHFSELPNKILTPTYECMDTILPIQARQDISKFPVYHTQIPSPQDPLSFASSSIPAISSSSSVPSTDPPQPFISSQCAPNRWTIIAAATPNTSFKIAMTKESPAAVTVSGQ